MHHLPVRAHGEQWKLYEPLIQGGHRKLKAVVERGQINTVIVLMAEHFSTGKEGGGILSVFDLVSVVKIRSKDQVKNS